jgi:hypothetical protein
MILTPQFDRAKERRLTLSQPRPHNMKTGIKAIIRFVQLASVTFAAFTVGRAAAQQPTDRSVQPAAFSRPATGTAVQQVRFSRQPAKVGDEVQQNIGLELRLTMSMRQGNQVTGKNQTLLRTNQRRVVTTSEVDSGRMTAVKVQYPVATKQMSAADVTDGKNDLPEPTLTPQPVQGKTYICRRNNGEKGELVVIDAAGNRPPSDEYEIVSQQMQIVGRPNPLAQFLAGRTIAVGDKVELPKEIASQIFNLGDGFGRVTRFTLTLQKVTTENSVTSAAFLAAVEASSNNATQMRLEVEGPLVVDVASCRAQKISLVGPIGMSQSRGTYSTAYQMIGTGRLQMSIASTYRDARR